MAFWWYWKIVADGSEAQVGKQLRPHGSSVLAEPDGSWYWRAETEALAAETAAQGVGKVVRAEHPLLAQYTADGFAAALHQLIQKRVLRTSSSRIRTRCATTRRRWPRDSDSR